MVAWHRIRTVLLDLDGTLLDLRFDNHFWLEHLPRRYAQVRGVGLDEARGRLLAIMEATKGSLHWYCLDYWAGETGLDLVALKREVGHLIAVHPHVPAFLDAVRRSGRRVVLVTNAHPGGLALKMEKTALGGRFHGIVSSHALGLPKEHPHFWTRLRAVEHFEPAATLFVDDDPRILGVARDWGIGQVVLACRPDSSRPPRAVAGFPCLHDFSELLPVKG